MAGDKTIYDVLEQEHRDLLERIERLQKARDPKERKRLFDEVRGEITAHAEAESATLYDALREHAETEDQVAESEEAHDEMKALLRELATLQSDGDAWSAKLGALRETVEQHVEEEEGDLFAAARDVLSEGEAQALAQRFHEEKPEPE